MKRVLIIGPNFFYFNDSIANAFRRLGWEAKTCAYDNPVHPYGFYNKVVYKLSRKREALREKGHGIFSDHVRNVYETYRPDLVFIVNGDALLPSVTEMMSEKSVVAVWMFDSVSKYPLMKRNLPYAKAVFCYECSDMEVLREECGVSASFLPQAADTGLYRRLPDERKLYDIVFAGDIWQSEKRQRILGKVVERFGDRKILIWGVYKPWYKSLWKWITRERRDVYMNRSTSPDVLNLCYNRAKVVLNIHNEQQVYGANPKVYEISASGAYQICDSNPYIDGLFPNGEVALYHTDEECLELIERRLAAPSDEYDAAAYELIANEHTFEKRIETVLRSLDMWNEISES